MVGRSDCKEAPAGWRRREGAGFLRPRPILLVSPPLAFAGRFSLRSEEGGKVVGLSDGPRKNFFFIFLGGAPSSDCRLHNARECLKVERKKLDIFEELLIQ